MPSKDTTKMYSIREVSQVEHEGIFVWIHFKMNDYQYEVEVRQQPTYGIQNVYHRRRDPKHPCPNCNRDSAICYALTREKEAIFKELILHPSIRLYWVGRKQFIH